MSCRNHGYPVKNTLEECDLIKRYFSGDYKMTITDAPSGPTDNEEKWDAYPDPKGCLMIFGGPMAYESRRCQKLMAREVNVAALGETILAFLKWSETTITFDRKDHPDHIPHWGCFPLSWTRSSARPVYLVSSRTVEVVSTSSMPRCMTPWDYREQRYDHLVLCFIESYPGFRPFPSGR